MSAEYSVKRRELPRAQNAGHGRFERHTAATADQRLQFVNYWRPVLRVFEHQVVALTAVDAISVRYGLCLILVKMKTVSLTK